MKQIDPRRRIEKRYGSVRAGLLTELPDRTPPQLALYWGIHVNTLRAWMLEERIERYVGYRAKDAEPAGVAG